MDIREMIIERIEFLTGDFTAILPVYEAITFIDEFVELDKIGYIEEDFETECDIMAISLVNGEWYIEDALYDDEVKYMESDVFFIDRDILEDIDMERLEGSIVIGELYTEIEDSLYNDFVYEDCCEEECECTCYENGFVNGYEAALKTIRNVIDDILED